MYDLTRLLEERHKQISDTFKNTDKIKSRGIFDLEQRIVSYCSSRELIVHTDPPLDGSEYRDWMDFWSCNGVSILFRFKYPRHIIFIS